jgi:hypothetical protein
MLGNRNLFISCEFLVFVLFEYSDLAIQFREASQRTAAVLAATELVPLLWRVSKSMGGVLDSP